MPAKEDFKATAAICAAIVGAGFASGREIVSFFSQFGVASWLGVTAASFGIGGIVYTILRITVHVRADTFPELYGALMGQPCQDAIHMLHGLMCLITAASMLAAGAELGALALDLPHAHEIGFLLTLLSGVIMVIVGMKSLSLIGLLLIPLLIAYFTAMASDGSIPHTFAADHLISALPMGLLYASFNGALAGSTICLIGKSGASPRNTALMTGTTMFILLSCANLAMLRAGDQIVDLALPSVVLAARWGVHGYYISIFILWLSILTTLCAMLSSLRAQLMSIPLGKILSLLLSTSGAAMMAVFGFRMLVEIVYPLLGWVSSISLISLMLFLPGKPEE